MKDVKENFDATLKLFNEVGADDALDSFVKEEMGKMKRVCVMNSMCITKMEANKGKLEQGKFTFKHTEHPFYPILDVTF